MVDNKTFWDCAMMFFPYIPMFVIEPIPSLNPHVAICHNMFFSKRTFSCVFIFIIKTLFFFPKFALISTDFTSIIFRTINFCFKFSRFFTNFAIIYVAHSLTGIISLLVCKGCIYA